MQVGAWMDERWNRWLVVMLALIVWACADEGNGCDLDGCLSCDGDGGAPPENPFPTEGALLPGGGHLQINQSVLNVVSDNLDPILDDLLEDGLSFCVEPVSQTVIGITIRICHRDRRCDPAPGQTEGPIGCQLEMELREPQLRFIAPDRVRLNARIGLDDSLPFQSGNCSLRVSGGAQGVRFSVDLRLTTGPSPRELVRIELREEDVGLNEGDISVSAQGNCGFIGLIVNLLPGLVRDQISGLVGPQIAELAGSLPEQLGIEGAFNLAGLLDGLLGGEPGDTPDEPVLLNYLAYAAGHVESVDDTRMQLGLLMGFDAQPSLCAPDSPRPSLAAVPPSPQLTTGNRPSGSPFDIGVALHERAANLALWSVYRSGALCLDLGGEALEALSTETLGLVLPSLGALADQENRPVEVRLRPQRAPVVRFGEDPLVTLVLEEAELVFLAFVRDRWTQVFSLAVDLELGIGLQVDPEGRIEPVIGDLGTAFQNFRVADPGFLSDDEQSVLVDLLPLFLELLLPELGDDLIAPIELPSDVLGFAIGLNEDAFAPIDGNSRLGVFVDFSAAPAPVPMRLPDGLHLVSLEHHAPSPDERAQHLRRVQRGEASLEPGWMAGYLQTEFRLGAGARYRPIELSWRWRGGMWSPWMSGPMLTVSSSILLLDGVHELEVRARVPGEGWLADTVVVPVQVDRHGPLLHLEEEGHWVLVIARDVVTADEDLVLRWRLAEGPWTDLSGMEPRVDLTPWAGQEVRLVVEARDEAGHVTVVERALHVPQPEPASAPVASLAPPEGPPEDGGVGCAMAPTSGAPSWLFGLLLGALLVRRRRMVLLAFAALSLAACSFDSTSALQACTEDEECASGSCVEGLCQPDLTTCDEDRPCSEGETCLGGLCVPDLEQPGCAADGDCGADEVCESGVCVEAAPECTSDGDCGTDEVCESGACVDAPPECTSDGDCGADEVCESGVCVDALPECTSDGDCGADEVCESGVCVDAPPECTSDGDCGADEVCESGVCVEAAPECTSDGDCGADEVCESGVCVDAPPECTQDAECDGDQVCEDGSCVDPPPECVEDRECEEDFACEAGTCVPAGPECLQTTDCEPLSICRREVCVPVECVATEDCPEGDLCENFTCRLGPDNEECSASEDCTDETLPLCLEGRCVAEPLCTRTEDVDPDTGEVTVEDSCEEPLRCLDGRCRLQTCGDGVVCDDGDVCEDGLCVPVRECRLARDCTDRCPGQVPRCEDGFCACDEICPIDCPASTYCCQATGRCAFLPDPCEALSCGVAEDPVLQREPVVGVRTCEVLDPGLCTCVVRPGLSVGDHGRSVASVRLDEDRVLLVASNETWGDLMVAEVAHGELPQWQAIDGVPDAPVVADPSGYRGGISVVGPRAGQRVVAAMDEGRRVHIVHRQVSADGRRASLRYVLGEQSEGAWTWAAHTLAEDGNYPALYVTDFGSPVVAFYRQRGALDGERVGALWLARTEAAVPASAEDWALQPLASAPSLEPCGGPCGGGLQCRTDVHRCAQSVRESLCGGCNGATCFRGEDEEPEYLCASSASVSGPRTLPTGTGLFPALLPLSEGRVGVAFHDRNAGTLMWAEVAGAEPPTVVVLDGGADATVTPAFPGETGRMPAVVMHDDRVLIAYADARGEGVHVVDLEAGTRTLVDDGIRVRQGRIQLQSVGHGARFISTAQGLTLVWQNTTERTLEASLLTSSGWSEPVLWDDFGTVDDGAVGFSFAATLVDGGLMRAFNRLVPDGTGLREHLEVRWPDRAEDLE